MLKEGNYYGDLAKRQSSTSTSTSSSSGTTSSTTTSSTTSTTSTTSTSSTSPTATTSSTTGLPTPTLSTTSTSTSSTATPSTASISLTPSTTFTRSTYTRTVTAGPTFTNSSDSSIAAAPTRTQHAASTGFFQNKGAVAGTFTAAGIVVVVLAVLLVTNAIRRRRAKRFDEDVAAAAAAAYRDADGYWEREDNWNNNAPPASSAYSSAYTDGTHGVYNEPAMAVPQADYQNYQNGGGYAPNNYSGGYQGGGGYVGGGEAYGMNNLSGAHHDHSFGSAGAGAGALVAGAAGVGAGAYAAHHDRQRSPPLQNNVYQGYSDMGMNDSLEGGRYPVPPVRSRSMNQGPQRGPGRGAGMNTSPTGSSSDHGHGRYGQSYQQGGPSPPSVAWAGSKSTPKRYSQNHGAPLPQMQEHHNEGDAYDGMTPESDHHSRQEHGGEYGEAEDLPRVLRVANE